MAKIAHIKAKNLHVGDRLVVQEGSIRKYRRLCEVHVTKDEVTAIYITQTGFEAQVFKPMHRVRINLA